MQRSLPIFILTLARFSVSLNYPSCPEKCFCNMEFTDCKYQYLTKLPTNLDYNVTSLDLSYNNFEEFPKELAQYSNLIYLNLSHNGLSVLDGSSALRYLKNLKILDLTFNLFKDWKDIQSEAFPKTKKLISLDFSNNPLHSIPQYSNPLRISSLKVLKLNNCSMRTLHHSIFNSLPNLTEFHAANNQITNINTTFISNSLKFLDLSNSKLEYIRQDALVNLGALETLWLHKNNFLKKFSCSSPSLLYLDLSDCNLEVIPNGDLPQVYHANFRKNHFKTIAKYSFQKMFNIENLDLSHNSISSIEHNAFEGLNNVKNIDLSFNTLSNLESETFVSNLQLKKLNLSRNYLNKIEKLSVPTLEILDLSHCEIQSVEQKSLINMPKLETLNLARNFISLLPDNFHGSNLRSLDLSWCAIKNLNNRTFTALHSLRLLKLIGNRLTIIYSDYFPQVTYLDISDNPWRCECTVLKDIYLWLIRSGMKMDNLFCQSPAIFEGKTWQEICQKEWHPELYKKDTVWWYTTGLIISIFLILFIIIIMRKMYMLKEKRLREADEARRSEEREALRRMRRIQSEVREEVNRNAPDPRELQRPPSYNEALLLPRLDASHPSLSGSLHSIASKQSLNGSNPDVSRKSRSRRKRRRRKSDSSEGRRTPRPTAESDTSEHESQPRALESDF